MHASNLDLVDWVLLDADSEPEASEDEIMRMTRTDMSLCSESDCSEYDSNDELAEIKLRHILNPEI